MEGLSPAASTGRVENGWYWGNAWAELDKRSPNPNLDEEMEARIANKSAEQIERRVEFEEVVASIEAGKAVISYDNTIITAQPSSPCAGGSSRPRDKGLRWTEEEHKAFLVGLQVYGKGNWSNISRFFVPTKTTSQVASHAQKYYRRAHSKTPSQRRRCSIHDTRILDSAIIQISPRLINPATTLYDSIIQNPHLLNQPLNPQVLCMQQQQEPPSIDSQLLSAAPPNGSSTPLITYPTATHTDQLQDPHHFEFLDHILNPFSSLGYMQ